LNRGQIQRRRVLKLHRKRKFFADIDPVFADFFWKPGCFSETQYRRQRCCLTSAYRGFIDLGRGRFGRFGGGDCYFCASVGSALSRCVARLRGSSCAVVGPACSRASTSAGWTVRLHRFGWCSLTAGSLD
jgi:hypothetical protein